MALQSTTALATVTLQASSTAVTFSSIPSTYRDLIVTISGSATGGTSPSLSFNGDTNSNYSIVRIYNSYGSALSQSFSANYISMGYMDASTTTIVGQIIDYASTDKHKTVLGRGSNTTTIRAEAGRWANTDAIHTVSVRMDGAQSYLSGTTISLYGRIA